MKPTKFYLDNQSEIDEIGINHILEIEKGMMEECNVKVGSNWHIAYVKPLSSANNMKEVKKLLHYTNLEPQFNK